MNCSAILSLCIFPEGPLGNGSSTNIIWLGVLYSPKSAIHKSFNSFSLALKLSFRKTQTYKIMKVKVINKSKHDLPHYSTSASAGMDLRANISKDIYLKSKEIKLIPTGIALAIPKKFEIQIRPRSGLAAKNGISIVNTPGTIDSDYRGEIKVILINQSKKKFRIKNGDRIAQMVISPTIKAKIQEVSSLTKTDRGSGGFGSTGK
mgnify:CR=1 FL=1